MPNGRAIRISFQTGFPSFKSIESRASLSPIQSKPKSAESDQHQLHSDATDDVKTVHSNEQAAASIGEPRTTGSGGFQPMAAPRISNWRRRRSVSSRKTVKSYVSRGVREHEHEQALDNANDDNVNPDE